MIEQTAPAPSAPAYAWHDVPKGTEATRCKRCGAVVYWIHVESTEPGRDTVTVPIDCTSEVASGSGAIAPTPSADGRGVSHWPACSWWQERKRAR